MAGESLYLCYAFDDQAFGEELGQTLLGAGYAVAHDDGATSTAESLIPPTLEDAAICIVVLSQAALRSPRLRQQARWFVGARARDPRKRLWVLWREPLPAEYVWVFLRPFPVISGSTYETFQPEHLITLMVSALELPPEEEVEVVADPPTAPIVPVLESAPLVTSTPPKAPTAKRAGTRFVPALVLAVLVIAGGVFAYLRLSPHNGSSVTLVQRPAATDTVSATGTTGATTTPKPSATTSPVPTATPTATVSSTTPKNPTPTSVPRVTSTPAPLPVIANAGFETPYLGPNGYQYNPPGGSWSFMASTQQGGSGIAGNSSGFTNGNPPAPEGVQVGVLQMQGIISQTISGFQPNTHYVLTFSVAQRAQVNSAAGEDFKILLGDAVLGTLHPKSSSYSAYSFGFTTAAGSQTLSFVGLDTAGGDNTVFIDNVRLTH